MERESRPNFGVPITIFVLFAIGWAVSLSAGRQPVAEAAPATQPAKAAAADPNLTVLFDGKSMGKWKTTEFGGEGSVEVADGAIVVNAGSTLSGINWTGEKLPTIDYELELEAKKISGSDFFLALTFPYKKDSATFVLGGWGGSLVGISNVNGNDAANNEYSTSKDFPKGKWYKVRLRVTADRIRGWLDDEKEPILDVETTDKEISTRADIDLAKPLGMSTYQTSAAYRGIKLRKL